MRHTPGFYRRLIQILLVKDAVRGGLCALLMLALVVGDAPLWLALSLPLLAYAGLRLLTPVLFARDDGRTRRHSPHDDRACFARCLGLRQEIETLSNRIDDPPTHDRTRQILAWIDRILGAIAEDGKYQSSAALLGHLQFTSDLVVGYLRVARRGVGASDALTRLQQNLTALNAVYERFWKQLNRDAVVNLEALSETIELDLK